MHIYKEKVPENLIFHIHFASIRHGSVILDRCYSNQTFFTLILNCKGFFPSKIGIAKSWIEEATECKNIYEIAVLCKLHYIVISLEKVIFVY